MKHVVPACLLILTSCTTTYLWNETDPYVLVSQNEITESELRSRKVKYVRDDQFGVFFVEKKALEKYTDYAIRVVGTPVTVAVDTATTIVVVGGAFYLSAYSSRGTVTGDPFSFIVGVMELLAEAAPQRRIPPAYASTNYPSSDRSRP